MDNLADPYNTLLLLSSNNCSTTSAVTAGRYNNISIPRQHEEISRKLVLQIMGDGMGKIARDRTNGDILDVSVYIFSILSVETKIRALITSSLIDNILASFFTDDSFFEIFLKIIFLKILFLDTKNKFFHDCQSNFP